MPSSLHDYDLRSRSKIGASRSTGKTIAKRKLSKPVEDLADNSSISRTGRLNPPGNRKAPHVLLSYTYEGLCDEKTSRKSALVALSSLNEKGRSEQDPKYQLIEALGCVQFRFTGLYHCNFIAKPRKGIEAESKLCFAEVQSEFKDVGVGMRTVCTCRFACILGPIGSETGFNGCTFCDNFPGYIQHPEDGFKKIFYTEPNVSSEHMILPSAAVA